MVFVRLVSCTLGTKLIFGGAKSYNDENGGETSSMNSRRCNHLVRTTSERTVANITNKSARPKTLVTREKLSLPMANYFVVL